MVISETLNNKVKLGQRLNVSLFFFITKDGAKYHVTKNAYC